MPFALVFIGLILIITGFQNTYSQLGSQLVRDFTGDGNFIYWLIAIGIIGMMGYNDTLKPFSRALMGLIIVVIFLSNKGFFTKFNEALKEGTSSAPLPPGGVPTATSGGGGGDSGGFFGDLLGGGGGIIGGLVGGFL